MGERRRCDVCGAELPVQERGRPRDVCKEPARCADVRRYLQALQSALSDVHAACPSATRGRFVARMREAVTDAVRDALELNEGGSTWEA